MADNCKNGRATDRSRVSMNEEQEIRYWTEYLGCTRGELAAAVARVGSSPDAVRREVYRHWGYGTSRRRRPRQKCHRERDIPGFCPHGIAIRCPTGAIDER